MYLETNQKFSIGERIAETIFPRVRERRALLEREASIDHLTGLANRAAFNRARPAAERDVNLSFIVFDCNNFGLVNKKMGFAFGDEILTIVATAIGRAASANNARAFRLGGDEFVVLCSRNRAEYIRDAIERRVGEFDYGSFKVSISGEIGANLDCADSLLQARKQIRKARVRPLSILGTDFDLMGL